MKIAIAQNNYTQTDVEGNKRLIISSIERARAAGADIVAFAAHALDGVPCYDLLRDPRMTEACDEAAVEIAGHCNGIMALLGGPNGAMLLRDGRVEGVDKLEKIAVSVNEISPEQAAAGEIVVVLAADRFGRGGIESRYNKWNDRGFRAGRPMVYVNQAGGQGDFVYDGSSFALDGAGRPTALLRSFGEDFAVVDTESVSAMDFPVQDRTRNSYLAIRLGLADYFRKNNFTKACLGMSGGIDSAVVLAIAAEVLVPRDIVALMLPSQFSSGHSVSDSEKMVATLGVEGVIIPIGPAYDVVCDSLAPVWEGGEFGVAEENLQSRIRGLMLMALSNKRGHILLNTSNKSESAVGYGTMYGDMTGALGPIADIYKVEVYALARYLNREREVIPWAIIEKEPSAELHPGQKDSDSLPPYEVLDAILVRLVEGGETPDEIIAAGGFDDAVVRRVWDLLKRAEYKRRQSPPALKVSQRPFGSHFKLPLVNLL